MATLYTQSQVYKLFPGTSKRTLHYWAQLGLMEWADEKRDLRGTHRLYKLKHLWQIALLEELALLGVHTTGAKAAMKWVQSEHYGFKATKSLILRRKRPDPKLKSISMDPKTYTDDQSISIDREAPEWDMPALISNESVGDAIQKSLDHSTVLVVINLGSIQLKVQRLLKIAGLPQY